jgi:hypothetical protein
MKIEELLGEHPPNQFFPVSQQLDAKQKAWLITRFADGDVDHLDAQLEDLHGTIEALNEHARKLHGGLDRKRELEGR